MSCAHLAPTLLTAALLAAPALARPIEIRELQIRARVGSTVEQTSSGGGPHIKVFDGSTSSGGAMLTTIPAASAYPIESLSLNWAKIPSASPSAPAGGTTTVSDDVIVDGRIITAENSCTWRELAGDVTELAFAVAPASPRSLEIVIRMAGQPVASFLTSCTSAGDCWSVHLPTAALCVELDGLCTVPFRTRLDPSGGITIDVPFLTARPFILPDHTEAVGDSISAILHPTATDGPLGLAALHIAYTGLPDGLDLSNFNLDLGCPADINRSGDLTVQDIFDFLAAYFAAAPLADFNASENLTVQDIFDFLAAYFAGCP